MAKDFRIPDEIVPRPAGDPGAVGAERVLKSFRYIVSTVNDDALRVWADLWAELKDVTPGAGGGVGGVAGWQPPGGWAEFLEKFWLLKHYLDYTRRVCAPWQPPSLDQQSPPTLS